MSYVAPDLNPDPYVIRYRGRYYCYASGEQSVPVLESDNLYEWEHLGSALRESGNWSYWAPCVVYDNGLFYMYYSSMPEGKTDPHYHMLKVAVSEQPEGPFRFCKTIFNRFSIDPHVVRMDDLTWHLFYSVNNVAGCSDTRPGTVILEDLMSDFYTPAGTPVQAVYPTRDEEIFARNRFNDGRDWHTIEGAFYFPAGDSQFLLYSGGAYTREYYFIDYAVKDSRGLWHKKPDTGFSPLLQGNTAVEGTGHNSIAVAPNLIDYWIVYHGRDRSVPLDPDREQRSLRIDPLYCRSRLLTVPGPSSGRQTGPAGPAFRDGFDGPETEPATAYWDTVSGNWTVGNGVLRSGAMGTGGVVCVKMYSGYVMEVSLCWEEQHSGGLFGAYAAYTDDRNFLSVLIDAGSLTVHIRSTRNGGLSEKLIPLSDRNFNPAVFHLLRIERTGCHFKIFIDTIGICEYDWYSGAAARTGLVSRYVRRFSSLFPDRKIRVLETDSTGILAVSGNGRSRGMEIGRKRTPGKSCRKEQITRNHTYSVSCIPAFTRFFTPPTAD